MDMYALNILDHFKHPRNYGRLEGADALYSGANHSCGDEISIFVKLDGNCISSLSFEGRGCAISMASASIMSELLSGKNISEVMSMDIDNVRSWLGIEISSRRESCALLALRSLKAALSAEQGL